MKLSRLVPMLASGDLAKTIAFYSDALGFSLGDKFESGGSIWWCEMKRDGVTLMFTQHETDVNATGVRDGFAQTSINLYLDEGIEALHARLAEQNYPVSDLRVTFYKMKEFELKDPSGYTLLIGQPTDEPPTRAGEPEVPF